MKVIATIKIKGLYICIYPFRLKDSEMENDTRKKILRNVFGNRIQYIGKIDFVKLDLN